MAKKKKEREREMLGLEAKEKTPWNMNNTDWFETLFILTMSLTSKATDTVVPLGVFL